ncbi:MAG: hypothetical protein JW940_29790 [Polyangiaceae bacterium]|nr:hypothetical protein [Polyangiaceae bacterium]
MAETHGVVQTAERPDETAVLGHETGAGSPVAATPVDAVEAALARAVELASAAGQWEVVAALSRELGERRRARTAPAVTSLEQERARRERKS